MKKRQWKTRIEGRENEKYREREKKEGKIQREEERKRRNEKLGQEKGARAKDIKKVSTKDKHKERG